MNLTLRLFQIGMKQIAKDGILLMLLPAPFLTGLLFKFAIPLANSILENKLSLSLLPWYGLVDGMLICLTPIFAAMVSAFLLLEERDEGICAFYQITPAGGYSYLAARIGIPMIWAFITTVIAMILFNISELSISTILTGSVISSLTGIFLAMMVVSLAGNRVEGLALSKLMSISLLGLIIVWLIPKPFCYFAAFLPSFWIGKLLMDGANLFSFIFGLILCLIWTSIFTRKFLSRIG